MTKNCTLKIIKIIIKSTSWISHIYCTVLQSHLRMAYNSTWNNPYDLVTSFHLRWSPHLKCTYTFKLHTYNFNDKKSLKDKNCFTLNGRKNSVRYIPRVKLKIQKSGLGGKRKINNLALRITKACQSASFKRNKRVYKDPRSSYRTSGVLKK